jgi:hypothetical protein
MSKSKRSTVTVKEGRDTRTYSNRNEAYKAEVKLAREDGCSYKEAHATTSSLLFGSSGKTSGPR